MMFVTTDYATYEANELNQYTRINNNGSDFTPEYDADGNQTRLQSATLDLLAEDQPLKHTILWDPTQPTATRPLAIQQSGTWYTYKTLGGCKGGWTCAKHAPGGRGAEGRLRVKTADGCKAGWTCVKHAPGGRGAVGRLRVNWDLIRLRVSLRSLATPRQAKNICELYTAEGQLTTTYTYTPYGKVTADGDVDQAIQWSSEVHDPDLALVYYNYRYYNPTDGRWTRRDPIGIEGGMNLYMITGNSPVSKVDQLGNLILLNVLPIPKEIIYKALQEITNAIIRVKSKIDSMIICAEGVKADMLALNVKAREKDKYRHCYGTCLMRLRCGITTQSLAAIWKEVDDIKNAVAAFPDYKPKIKFFERVLDSLYDYIADYSCPFESSEDDCLCCCNRKYGK